MKRLIVDVVSPAIAEELATFPHFPQTLVNAVSDFRLFSISIIKDLVKKGRDIFTRGFIFPLPTALKPPRESLAVLCGDLFK